MGLTFCMQHDYEAKRSELLEAEQKVDELRKQLEQALLAARGKREAAVAAKRKFEAARRRLDAEMATVREKVLPLCFCVSCIHILETRRGSLPITATQHDTAVSRSKYQ
jgi:hypothetical protein